MRASATRRERFWPYGFDELALVLEPDRAMLDGKHDVTVAYHAERHLLDLSAQPFETVEIELRLVVPAELIPRVFPADELTAPSGRLVVLQRCRHTRLRRAHDVGPVHEGVNHVAISIDRRDVLGTVELTPVLVRSSARSNERDGFASARTSRLASGRALEVRFEELGTPPGEFLDLRYESFKVGPPRFPFPTALYQLEFADTPTLWINSDHARVRAILDASGTVGRAARARDVVFGQIAHAVWSRLFWRSARDLVATGDVIYPWQDAVLDRLLKHVYPDSPDHTSRIEALRQDILVHDEDSVHARLDGALQDLLELPLHATSLAVELE